MLKKFEEVFMCNPEQTNRSFDFELTAFVTEADGQISDNPCLNRQTLEQIKAEQSIILVEFSFPGLLDSINAVLKLSNPSPKLMETPHWFAKWMVNKDINSDWGKQHLDKVVEKIRQRIQLKKKLTKPTKVSVKPKSDKTAVNLQLPQLLNVPRVSFCHLLCLPLIHIDIYLLLTIKDTDSSFRLKIHKSTEHVDLKKMEPRVLAQLVE